MGARNSTLKPSAHAHRAAGATAHAQQHFSTLRRREINATVLFMIGISVIGAGRLGVAPEEWGARPGRSSGALKFFHNSCRCPATPPFSGDTPPSTPSPLKKIILIGAATWLVICVRIGCEKIDSKL